MEETWNIEVSVGGQVVFSSDIESAQKLALMSGQNPKDFPLLVGIGGPVSIRLFSAPRPAFGNDE